MCVVVDRKTNSFWGKMACRPCNYWGRENCGNTGPALLGSQMLVIPLVEWIIRWGLHELWGSEKRLNSEQGLAEKWVNVLLSWLFCSDLDLLWAIGIESHLELLTVEDLVIKLYQKKYQKEPSKTWVCRELDAVLWDFSSNTRYVGFFLWKWVLSWHVLVSYVQLMHY